VASSATSPWRSATAEPRRGAAARRRLGDAEPLVRGHAAWALGRLGSPAARGALERARRREDDATVAGEIDAALAT
jgi:epoxyqueuosine reductase